MRVSGGFPMARAQRPLLVVLCAALAACGATGGADAPQSEPFRISNLVKSDIDMVAEVTLQETLAQLRQLMEKLYRRNPREWRDHGQPGIDAAVARAFDDRRDWNFPDLGGRRGVDCIHLAFDEAYAGDRVLAFVVGLGTMIIDAYNGKTQFHALDDLDPQRLYNAARNIEIAAWKLANARDRQGRLFLVSNGLDADAPNLSFERVFGKMIAHQDAMAGIMAQKTNRRIRYMIQGLASAVFLPI